jgi:hypothetical protein
MHSSPEHMRITAPDGENRGAKSGDWRGHLFALAFFGCLYAAFFAPATLAGRFLAPGDGTLYYLPHFRMPLSIWDPNSITGFPSFADPQLMTWYLPALLSRVTGSWNLLVLSAYVLGSWFTYRYLRVLTGHAYAAVVGGLVFGLSGFMMLHLGHATVIHVAAWIPGLLWAVEEMAQSLRIRWVLIGGVIGSQCILGGHPQIVLYGWTLAIAYALFRAAYTVRVRRYLVAVAAMVVLAAMLSAAQTIPTAAFSSLTTRTRMSFEDFSTYSLSPKHLLLLAFPALFGDQEAALLDGIPYLAAGNLAEVSGYVGFGAMALALLALASRARNAVVLFWAGCAGLALAASMGGSTPLGNVVYHLPGFGQFRAQGRFMALFCIAIAALAAQGIVALTEHPKRPRHLGLMLSLFAAFALAGFAIAPLLGTGLRAAAAAQGFPNLPVGVFTNRWISIPLACAALVTASLAALVFRPQSTAVRALALASMAVELGSFGWFADWRYVSPTESGMQPPAVTRNYAARLRETGGRWFSVQGSLGARDTAPPELSALWRMPALGKYGPLMPSRYRELMEIESNGIAFGKWWDPRNRALDIAGARLVAFPISTASESFRGSAFPSKDIDLSAGHGCGAAASNASLTLRPARRASRIGVVSMMACSNGYPQGTPVVEVRLRPPEGRESTVVLRAGIDTAEWAAGCADVAPTMRHQPAEVFSRFPTPRNGAVCQGQRYVTFLDLPKPLDIAALQFRWLPEGEGMVRILKLVLLKDDGRTEAVGSADAWAGDASRWKEFARSGATAVYENLHARPRAWLVPETVSLPAADVKRAIQTSTLPDGRPYDPAATALIEEPLGFRSALDAEAKAWVVEDRKTALDVRTVSGRPSFLVLGDLYHPDWKVTINGRPGRVFQTNYIQRGVLLPAGQNLVRFEFHPASLYAGFGISAAGLLLGIAAAVAARRKGRL